MTFILRSEAPIIIRGKVVKHQPPAAFQRAGLTWLGQKGLVRLQLGGRAVILRGTKIITRSSGRQAHLAHYLRGICTESGTPWEVFLGVVTGLRSGLFQLRLALTRQVIKTLGRGLSPLQTLKALLV